MVWRKYFQIYENGIDSDNKYNDVVRTSYDKRISSKDEITNLFIYSVDYMVDDVLIPFLDWHSKKELDYKD